MIEMVYGKLDEISMHLRSPNLFSYLPLHVNSEGTNGGCKEYLDKAHGPY